MLTITILEGTTALDEDGNPLSQLAITVDETPPSPQDTAIIGLAYDFQPSGATFNPPMTLTSSYDPTDMPTGVAEEDLVLAYYDEETGAWVTLPCVVDPETNTITAEISHFTSFAVIAYIRPAAFATSNLSITPAEVNL